MGNFDYDSLHTSFMTDGYFYDNYYADDDTIKQDAAALKYVKTYGIRQETYGLFITCGWKTSI